MTPADRYERWRMVEGHFDESTFPAVEVRLPEMEVQARWFAGQFSRRMVTMENRSVEIVDYGIWNREPGPDFSGAVVRIGDDPPRHGAIEIDLDRRDWERHGHATNPAYENVILHVFVEPGAAEFFSRTVSHRQIPQARLSLGGVQGVAPFPPLARLGRCSAPLALLTPEKVCSLLEAAAHFRLREKSRQLQQLVTLHGRSEALFQRVARALGYKENKLPFELLAQRLPLTDLRKSSCPAEALLFGAAGFLDAPDLAGYEGDTRIYLRQLWDQWWSRRSQLQHLMLPRSLWKFTGTRPANHPQRRLAALTGIVRQWKVVESALLLADPEPLTQVFGKLRHPYWENHYTLTSKISPSPMPLIGASRVLDILANIAVPQAMQIDAESWQKLRAIRQPLSNRHLETAALRLFGGSAAQRKLLSFALYQQGLLQIYEDFCLRDLTDCAHCPFPAKVGSWDFEKVT